MSTFDRLADFSQLVVISTNNPPRNQLLSTDEDQKIGIQTNQFYVWRVNPSFPEPHETARVPVPGNPLINNLIVMECAASFQNLLLSTSYNTPLVKNGNSLYVWRAPEASTPATHTTPALSAEGVAALTAGMAGLAAAALRRMSQRQDSSGGDAENEPEDLRNRAGTEDESEPVGRS